MHSTLYFLRCYATNYYTTGFTMRCQAFRQTAPIAPSSLKAAASPNRPLTPAKPNPSVALTSAVAAAADTEAVEVEEVVSTTAAATTTCVATTRTVADEEDTRTEEAVVGMMAIAVDTTTTTTTTTRAEVVMAGTTAIKVDTVVKETSLHHSLVPASFLLQVETSYLPRPRDGSLLPA
jgi:hypothetical protein